MTLEWDRDKGLVLVLPDVPQFEPPPATGYISHYDYEVNLAADQAIDLLKALSAGTDR